MTDPAARAREFVLDTHGETVETVLACADAVADDWDGRGTTDRAAVADPLRAELQARGAWARLPDVLAGAVRAAGYSLSASPVADPPYVAATSRGPMLRATVPDGRLIVLLQVFEIERGGGGDESGGTGESRSVGENEGDGESRSDGESESDSKTADEHRVQYVRGPRTPADAVRVTFE